MADDGVLPDTSQSWSHAIDLLKSMPHESSAVALLGLLEQARGRWEATVVAGTSHLDLMFSVPGDRFPFEHKVRTTWANQRFDMRLVDRWERVITADYCFAPNATVVLDALLLQLTRTAGDIPGH